MRKRQLLKNIKKAERLYSGATNKEFKKLNDWAWAKKMLLHFNQNTLSKRVINDPVRRVNS